MFFLQDSEFRISQLNCTLTAREEEIEVLKTKLLDEKQKLCDCELSYQDEVDKRESHIKALKTEVYLSSYLKTFSYTNV